MKLSFPTLILSLIFLLPPPNVFPADNAHAGKPHIAEVTDLSGSKYFPAVESALSRAKTSITLAMFLIESSPKRPGSKPNQLIDALVAAKARGVEVDVILDQNIDFVGGGENSDRNMTAYARLKEAGIKVSFDDPNRYVHAKTIVIDKEIVILGSTNWTSAALEDNIETAVLIYSPGLAEEILNYLKNIETGPAAGRDTDPIGPGMKISREFIENANAAPLLVKAGAGRAFDVYLYLLREAYSKKASKLAVSYESLAKYLGIHEGWTSAAYRRQIIKVFKKLERKYKLVKFEPDYAKDAAITLLSYKDGGGEQGQYFQLPDDYFNLGWNRKLMLRAKFCYLINLACFSTSKLKPYWSKSVITLTKEFGGVGQDVISKGMGELRRKGLLTVRYDELSGKPYNARRPKMYKILKLYDPRERKGKLWALEKKYGKGACAKAKTYAKIVFEENNPEVIEDIIAKTKEYGEKEIKRAFGEAGKKNVDNPKRNYVYVTRILGKQ